MIGLTAGPALAALQVNLDSTASIKQAAAQVVDDLLSFYSGDKPGQIPGILPGPPPTGPYYWWIGGALWGTMLDYRLFTGDTSHDEIIMKALTFQVGDGRDYMPANWTASMGNDDQAFWALASLSAAEMDFTTPPEKTGLDWLALAQAVFNEQTDVERRVEKPGDNCDGGLRWQVFSFNNGWDYVNTISSACYFNVGARLFRYTHNSTYADLADKTWEWLTTRKYIDNEGNVYDGAHEPNHCEDINKFQFSYNPALLMQGAAFLYNGSSDDQQAKWKMRLDSLLQKTLDTFFPGGIATEVDCELSDSCTVDMKSFKGYAHRWLASTAILAPYTRDTIWPVLKTSAEAAVAKCNQGSNGRMCRFKWAPNDQEAGGTETQAVQQMNVVGALTSLLAEDAVSNDPNTAEPKTQSTGGSAKGDPDAGQHLDREGLADITTGDKVGAAFLSVIILSTVMVTFTWISV